MQMSKKTVLFLLMFLFLKAAAIIWLIIQGYIGLGPDEAQYWTWSQKLNWGYYSKPPGIAWQIWLGSRLFGNSELGVRIGAVAIGTALPFAIYWLAYNCRLKPWTCTTAALLFAFSPLGFASSFFAITDGGMVLFWTLAAGFFCRALQQESHPQYFLIGTMIFFGALFKWPIYLFWGFVIGTLFVLKKSTFTTGHPSSLFGGILVSLLGLLPSFIWNRQHDWPTFRHVFSTLYSTNQIDSGTTNLMRGNFGDFLGAQAVLVSPILFGLLLMAYWQLIKEWKNIPRAIRFCGASSLMIILSYAFISIFKKMQGNWCDFAYPTAIVFLSWHVCERATKLMRWAYAGAAVSAGLVCLFLSIPYLQKHGIPQSTPIPFKSNPFKHNLGWDQLSQELISIGYKPEKHFLFADRYQTSSILSFYSPGQKLAYFFNLHGIRKNQFSYWPGMKKKERHRTGFFVIIENSFPQNTSSSLASTQDLLTPYFETIEFIKLAPLFESHGTISKGAYIYKCINYNGKIPSESGLY